MSQHRKELEALERERDRAIQQASALAEEVERLQQKLTESQNIKSRLMRVGMANARHILRPKTTSNAGLFCHLFGTGFTTAAEACRRIGLDPDGTKSSLNDSRMPEDQPQ